MSSKIIQIIIPTALLLMTGCKNPGNKYFFGTIEYVYTYSSDSLNVDSLTASRPAKGFFRYDTTDYQSTFIGSDTVNYFLFR